MAQYYQLNELKIEFKISIADIDLNNTTYTLIIYAYLPIKKFFKILPDLIIVTLIALTFLALIIHEKSKEWRKNEIKYTYN